MICSSWVGAAVQAKNSLKTEERRYKFIEYGSGEQMTRQQSRVCMPGGGGEGL